MEFFKTKQYTLVKYRRSRESVILIHLTVIPTAMKFYKNVHICTTRKINRILLHLTPIQ